ncbi:MAG: hypothetical protein ABSA79_10480 [Candidatus Bathyarchaeia archaeon]
MSKSQKKKLTLISLFLLVIGGISLFGLAFNVVYTTSIADQHIWWPSSSRKHSPQVILSMVVACQYHSYRKRLNWTLHRSLSKVKRSFFY